MQRRISWAHLTASVMLLGLFALYHAGFTNQTNLPDLGAERFSLVVAVSEAYHGAAGNMGFATLARGMLDQSKPLDARLVEAKEASIPSTHQPTYMQLLGDVGTPDFFAYSLWLFGPDTASFLALFLILIFVSFLLFFIDFRSDPNALFASSVVLAMMLLVSSLKIGDGHSVYPERWAQQLQALYSYRGLSLIAVIPTLHILLRLLKLRTDASGLLLVAAQSLVIAAAILLRRTSYYSLISIVLAGIGALVWIITAKSDRRALLISTVVTIVVPLLTFTAVKQIHGSTLHPDYLAGLKGSSWWYHRLYISLGMHPDWPFEQLTCQYLTGPKGQRVLTTRELEPKVSDRNGLCAYMAWRRKNGSGLLAANDIWFNSPDYDSALREVFFETVRNHPGKVAETFLLYKPWVMAKGAAQDFRLIFRATAGGYFTLVAAGLCVLLGAYHVRHAGNRRGMRLLPELAATGTLAAGAAFPLLYAWSQIYTNSEFLIAVYAFGFLLALFALQRLVSDRPRSTAGVGGAPRHR